MTKNKGLTLEKILTYSSCYVTISQLKKTYVGQKEVDFSNHDQLAKLAMQYFCDRRKFNRFHHQGDLVPIYFLIEADTNEMVAYALPVNDLSVICEDVNASKFLPRDNGVIERGGRMLTGFSHKFYSVQVPGGYDD